MSTRRILSCILLPAYLSSCTAWHVQRASPAQVVQEEQPSQVRLSPPEGQGYCLTNDGVYQAAFDCPLEAVRHKERVEVAARQEHLVMRSPTVAGVSLVGLIEGNESLVALEEIDQVATRTFSPLKTLKWVVIPLAVITLFLWGYCAWVEEDQCAIQVGPH